MKILFVAERLEGGGAEKVDAILASYFADKYKHDVKIVKYFSGNAEFPVSKKVEVLTPENNFKFKYFEVINEYFFTKKIIDQFKPDVIISLATYRTNIMLGFGFRNRSFPLIMSERNDPNKYPAKPLYRYLRNIAYSRCDGMVFQTDDARKYFEGRVTNKSVVIQNPIYVDRNLIYDGIREKTIVNMSRLTKQKNIPLLLSAFQIVSARFPDYTIHIYGDGELRKKLLKLTEDMGLGDKVIFHGLVKNVLAHINKASIYVSSSDYEGISNAMLEALALGLPTICTDCPIGGARMTIKDGVNGLLAPVGDRDKLADAMIRLLGDREYAERLGKKGREIVKELTEEKIAEEWINYIYDIHDSSIGL